MSLIAPTPGDIAAFVAAQDELRQSAGTLVSFGVPQDPTWPAGTPINPDTGLPFDATVTQANAEFQWVDVPVLVIEKEASPMRPQADAYFNESGFREGMDLILDVGAADYDATVSQATTFKYAGRDFQIAESKPFTLGGTTYRWLTYGAAK